MKYFSGTILSLGLLCFLCALNQCATAQGLNEEIPEPHQVAFDTVVRKANRLSTEDFDNGNSTALPKVLKELTYDEYRAIRFKSDEAIWKNQSLFEIQLLHPGFLYDLPVMINTVDQDGTIQSINFNKNQFNYDTPITRLRDEAFDTLAYSGFRIHFPLNTSSYKDEVLAFQGASYFRFLSQKQSFGLSARGLAINTASEAGEEFPFFSEFWLLKPDDMSGSMYIFALLNSPSLTGAYQFELKPGHPTILNVKMKLFAREDISKLGIAPLTSMFLAGENSSVSLNDYRKEIHDSDGLQIHMAKDNWIWRPLVNPSALSVVSFAANELKGFGLMQRDNRFENYLDVGAAFQTRPSYWVTPKGSWGQGRVELVEIPTKTETNDNIVAYWVPVERLQKGESIELEYSVESVTPDYGSDKIAKVIRTRIGNTSLPGYEPEDKKARRFVIDYSGDAINNLSEDIPIKAFVESTSGEPSEINVIKLPNNLGWRLTFVITPLSGSIADMRAYLSLRQNTVSEVWTYVWSS